MDRRKYKKGGDAGSKGVRFQVSLLTLFLLKSICKLKNWRLSTENNEAGKFDDAVLESPDGAVLLQAKHRDNKKTITFEELLSANTKNDDFSLPKYFISYQETKHKFKVQNVIVCTNANIHKKTLEFMDTVDASPENMLYHEEDDCLVYTFNDKILPDLRDQTKIYLQQCRNKKLDESDITDENLKEFLMHLQFYFNYPSGKSIENVIETQLFVVKDISNFYKEISLLDVYFKVMDWFQQKDGEYLTEIHAKGMFFEIKREKYWQKLERYNVQFQLNKLSFSNPTRIFHIVDDDRQLLQELQVFRALQEIKKVLYVFPESTLEEFKETVEAFGLPCYTFLIVVWPKTKKALQTKDITSKLEQVLNNYKYKTLVLVTGSNNELARQFQLSHLDQDIIKGPVSFDDLLKETQANLLKKKILSFQGNSFNLEELFDSETTEDYGTDLNSEILENLIRGDEVRVGRTLQVLDSQIEHLYMDRNFIRYKENVEEGNIFEVNEKVILIADGPGSGKSTLLTNLAISIKKKHPHLWVIRITLGDYTRTLKHYLGENKTLNLVQLLDSQIETRLTHQLEKHLFSMNNRVVLMLDGVDEISPNYTKLVTDLIVQCQQVNNIVKIFVTTRPQVVGELEYTLEVVSFKLQPFTELNQVDFLTKYWSRNLNLSSMDKAKCERFAEAMLSQMWISGNWYYMGENHFASIPLQVMMLAEIFQERAPLDSLDWQGCKEYLAATEEEPKLPKQIDFAKLFKMFLDKKRNVFLEKGNPTANTIADRILNEQFDECLAYHRVLALEVIVDEQKRELFTNYKRDKETIKPDTLYDIGIVQKVNSEVRFVHRTFAEYFVAECLITELQCQNQNVEFQKLFIDEVLQTYWYSIVRTFFNSFLQNVVDSLPSNMFNEYQRCVRIKDSEERYPQNLIHDLAGNGYVATLQLILKCIDFKSITKEDVNGTFFRRIHKLFKKMNQKMNTLNLLRFYVQQNGVNIRHEYTDDMPIHRAIDGGHFDMVKFLIQQGAILNCTKPPNIYLGHGHQFGYEFQEYHTRNFDVINTSTLSKKVSHLPLYRAVAGGHLEIIKFLVEQGASIKAEDDKDYRIMYEAISRKCVTVVEYLLEKILETDDSAPKDPVIPCAAAYLGRVDILEALLKRGVTVNDRTSHGIPLLFCAALGAQLDMIRWLVQQGADINSKDKRDNTALHITSKESSLTMTTKLLIDLGIDVNVKNQIYNETALHIAASEGNLDTIKCLLTSGADITVRRRYNRTVLHAAINSSRLDVVKLLVDHGVEVDARDDHGLTAMDMAISRCQFQIVELFLERVGLNSTDEEGRTKLHHAAMFGHVDTLRFLIERGVSLNVTDEVGCTALHLAAARGNLDTLKLLLDSGIDINARNKNGFTALHSSVEACFLDGVECLVECGIDVNIKDDKGRTALHIAVCLVVWNDVVDHCKKMNINSEFVMKKMYGDRLSVVKCLVTHGADLDIEDMEGNTVVTLIKKMDNPDLCECLDLKMSEEHE